MPEIIKVTNQSELDAAILAGGKRLEIHGKWETVKISGTAKVGSVDEKKYFGATLAHIQADHAAVLALALPNEIAALRTALVAGKVDGHMYDGECSCLVGTLEKAGGRKPVQRDSSRLAEKWYMAISAGHTPQTNSFSRLAVEWIDAFTAAAQPVTQGPK